MLKICKEIDTIHELIDYINEEHGIDGPQYDNSPGNGPCYQTHIYNTEDLPKEISVADLLHLLTKNDGQYDVHVLTFSVTDKEDNYVEWVEAAMSIPGATVTVIEKYPGEDNAYFCYFCTIPTVPNLEAL